MGTSQRSKIECGVSKSYPLQSGHAFSLYTSEVISMKPRGRHSSITRHRRGWRGVVYAVIIASITAIIALLSIHTNTLTESTISSRITTSVQRVVLLIDCGKCGKPCTSNVTSYPDCPQRLEEGVKRLEGVYSALFIAGYATGKATFEYNHSEVSLQAIEATITQTTPYPVCCTGISLASNTWAMTLNKYG
jgi:hypothetical protein